MRALKNNVWPYQVTVTDNKIISDDWCKNHIGRRFRDWYSYNIDHSTRIFAFKDEATLLVFKLACNYKG